MRRTLPRSGPGGPEPRCAGRRPVRAWLLALALVAGVLPAADGRAQTPLTFTDEAEFRFALDVLVAISGFAETPRDFEGLAAGATLPNGTDLDGLSLVYSLAGLEAQVRADFETTSPTRYLGLDTPDGAFVSGDSLAFVSGEAIHALGLFVEGETATFRPGDFELRTDAGVRVTSTDAASRVLADGEAIFLGVIDPRGFRRADLESFDARGTGLFVFDVDDVTTAVPEPGSALAALGLGLALLLLGRHRDATIRGW